MWQKYYDGWFTDFFGVQFHLVVVDPSDDIIVARNSNTNNFDFLTVKYSGVDGGLLWVRAYGSLSVDTLTDLAVDSEGNIFVGGNAWNDGSEGASSILKYAGTDGTLLWRTSSDCFYGTLILDRHNNPFFTDYVRLGKYGGTDGALLWDYPIAPGVGSVAFDSHNNLFLAGGTAGGGLVVTKMLADPAQFTSITLADGALHLRWVAPPGAAVQQTSSLSLPEWQTLPGSANTNRLSVPVTGTASFFRFFGP